MMHCCSISYIFVSVPDVEKDDLNDLVENPTMETVDSSEDDEDEVSLNDNDELQKHLGASETAQRIKLLQLTEKVGQAVTIWDSDEQFESFCGSISPAPVVQTTSPSAGLFQEMGRALTLWESEEQFDSFRASISPAISPTSAPNTSLMQRQ
jgi:hypothetical protein